MHRLIAILALWLMAFAAATPAAAHTSLISSDPADASVVMQAPSRITLTFNEPVSIVVVRLIDAAGAIHSLGDARLDGEALVATMPTGLPDGTNVVSWRVVSADGHPIGGTLVFSVGKETGSGAAAEQAAAPGLYAAIWAAGFVFNLGMFLGIGGAFFAAWIAGGAMPRLAHRITTTALVAGIVAAPIALALQGLDLLGVGFTDFFSPAAWTTALRSTFGSTVIVAIVVLVLALIGMTTLGARFSRVLSGVALLGLGIAFSLSGHAANAPPRALSSAAVFLHGVAVAFWAGSLIPLGLLLWKHDAKARPALIRFSRAIPFAILPLVAAGVLLVVVQMTTVSDLWTTNYGRVLAVKLVLVAALFTLAAANRFRHTHRALGGHGVGTRTLVRSIGVETVAVIAIFALVALWRFTPPPRNLEAAAASVPPAMAEVMSPGAEAKAKVTVTPGRAGRVQVSVEITDLAEERIEPRKVVVKFANPRAGIEAISREATIGSDGTWRVDGLTLPLAGAWTVGVDALISDFVLVNLEGVVLIR